MNDLVSVIVPVFNCQDYIDDCINGLMKQTYPNIEIILINDGSTDHTEEKCLQAERIHSTIHYYFQKNGGASAARNNGLQHATGNYVIFVDSDDQVRPNLIERLMELMDESTDITCCSYAILGENREEQMFENEIVAANQSDKTPFFLQLMDYTYGHNPENATAIGVPWAKLFRRSLIERNQIRFDLNLRRMQDNIFIMETFYHARGIKYVNDALYEYRVDHINSYKTVSYSPEIYIGVLNRRDDFLRQHEELWSQDVYNYLYKEHLNYLMMSIHYIVEKGNGNKQDRIRAIKKLCNDPTYEVLNRRPTNALSKKQIIQWVLIRLHLYRLVFEIYKAKY